MFYGPFPKKCLVPTGYITVEYSAWGKQKNLTDVVPHLQKVPWTWDTNIYANNNSIKQALNLKDLLLI